MAISVPPEPVNQIPARSGQALTIAQLIINGLGMVFSLLIAGLMFVLGLINIINQPGKASDTTSVFAFAWIALLVAFLSAPSLFFAIRRLADRDIKLPRFPAFATASALLLLWLLVLLLGGLVENMHIVAQLLLPPLEILAVGIPIWWLVEFARRNISIGGPQRSWGILSFSVLITTPLVIVIETLIIIGIAVLFVAWVSTQPEILQALERIANQLSSGRMDPQELLNLVQPYLQNPLAILAALALVAGIIPMIEELFKPLAIWLLAGRQLTTAQGFAAGAICGAAFALLESLLTVGGNIERGWAFLVIARTGTALLHITTTALVGSALAAAWQHRTYLRLALTYAAACILHGLWNTLSVFSSLGTLIQKPAPGLGFLPSLAFIMPFLLGILVVFLFMLVWYTNGRVQRMEPALPNPVTLRQSKPEAAAAPDTLQTRPTGSADVTGEIPGKTTDSL